MSSGNGYADNDKTSNTFLYLSVYWPISSSQIPNRGPRSFSIGLSIFLVVLAASTAIGEDCCSQNPAPYWSTRPTLWTTFWTCGWNAKLRKRWFTSAPSAYPLWWGDLEAVLFPSIAFAIPSSFVHFIFQMNSNVDVCIDALLDMSVQHSPYFDWFIAHIGSCFPNTIITRVLACGLKDFCALSSMHTLTEKKAPKVAIIIFRVRN